MKRRHRNRDLKRFSRRPMIVVYILALYLVVNFAMRVSAQPYPETMKLVNFLVFALVIYRLLKKPLLEMIDSKIRDVDELVKRTGSELSAAIVQHKEAQQLIAGLEEEVSGLLTRAKQQGEIEREMIIEDGKRRARNILQQGQVTLEGRQSAINQEMHEQIARRCVEKARAKIASTLSPKMHLAIIRSRISKVGRRI